MRSEEPQNNLPLNNGNTSFPAGKNIATDTQTRPHNIGEYYDSIQVILKTMDRPTWPTPFSRSPGFPVDNAYGHRRRRHRTSRLRDCPLSATERFPSPRHEHGTVCQPK